MLGSQNHFFKRELNTLYNDRIKVVTLLDIKGYSKKEIEVYIKAYNYFIKYQREYDGATIVKDLTDIPNLDLDAMLHDYHYLVYNVAKSFKSKFYADWIYAKGQERKGKGSYSSFSRFLGLSVIGLFFVPYTCLKKRNKNIDNTIHKDYKTLIK